MRSVVFAVVAIVLNTVVCASWGQGIIPKKSVGGIVLPSQGGYGTLIDDVTPSHRSFGDVRRFSLTQIGSHALLLDAATGTTWVLVEAGDSEISPFKWIEIPVEANPKVHDRLQDAPTTDDDDTDFDPFQPD